ncbi:MAG TPA: asparagine synthase (glutamine-hydrolyzing), partial [Acidimicrobiales bacterium]
GRMGATLAHRGPDDAGIFTSPAHGVALAHRRLSIVDLSPAGAQPMATPDGRHTIVYNGELYNRPELAAELESAGVRFRGHSDTEVVLHALATWGPAGLDRMNGMFALASWDGFHRVMTLARDPLGEKPLYYGWQKGSFFFASELKGLHDHPDFCADLDLGAVASFFHYGYIPAPASVYRGVSKLLPGSWLQVGSEPGPRSVPHRFWSPERAVEQAIDERSVVDLEELDRLLDDAVARRMVADVPVGAFLSGGIDSATVVSRMQASSHDAVKTFTVGFDVAGFDESETAKTVASLLGTDHTELRVSSADVRAAIPVMPEVYDEPFGDSSQLPTYLVSQLAHRSVKVALSGDGGDELFAGYPHYRAWPRLWSRSRAVPRPVRRVVARALDFSPSAFDHLATPLRHLPFGADFFQDRLAERMAKVSTLLSAATIQEAYVALAAQWPPRAGLVASAPYETPRSPGLPGRATPTESLMLADTVSYLPDDILVKVDRASMAVGLEVRVPLLDVRVVEAAWRLPLDAKLSGGRGKLALRTLLARRLPEALFERPKAGFVVPIAEWLRGPLREWASELLSPSRLAVEGYLDVRAVQRCWSKHKAGLGNWDQQLWNVLMFESWLDAQGRGSVASPLPDVACHP